MKFLQNWDLPTIIATNNLFVGYILEKVQHLSICSGIKVYKIRKRKYSDKIQVPQNCT